MDKTRLEAFTDAVIAIIITIMVLEFEVPDEPTWSSLWKNWPVFVSYALSFAFVALVWSSHRYLFQGVTIVNNNIQRTNFFVLFWLSLLPFSTAWLGENAFKSAPVTLYAILLTVIVIGYVAQLHQLRSLHGFDSDFSKSKKGYQKAFLTIFLNLLAILVSTLGAPALAFILLSVTAMLWFVPSHKYKS